MGTSDMPDATPAAAPKVAPESVALRASPRPVTRLNRRMLAVGAGTLAAAVLGGTLWSLQSNKRERNPATELYNVDRVSRAENLDLLPKDYAGIRPALKQAPPMLGEPLPGDLGPAIVKAQQPMETRPPGGGVDPAQAERLAAEEAARSSVFFEAVAATLGRGRAPYRPSLALRRSLQAISRSTQWGPLPPQRSPRIQRLCRTGRIRRRRSSRRQATHPRAIPEACSCRRRPTR